MQAQSISSANTDLTVSPHPDYPSELILHGVGDFLDPKLREVILKAVNWDQRLSPKDVVVLRFGTEHSPGGVTELLVIPGSSPPAGTLALEGRGVTKWTEVYNAPAEEEKEPARPLREGETLKNVRCDLRLETLF